MAELICVWWVQVIPTASSSELTLHTADTNKVMPSYGEDNQKCTTDIPERDCMIRLVKFSLSCIALLVQFTSFSSARWHHSSDLCGLNSTWGSAVPAGTDWINLRHPYIPFCHKNSYVIETIELNQMASIIISHQTCDIQSMMSIIHILVFWHSKLTEVVNGLVQATLPAFSTMEKNKSHIRNI